MRNFILIKNKNLLIYLTFTLINNGVGFSSAFILFKFLEPSQFGRIAICGSIQFLLLPLISISADYLIAVNKSKLTNNKFKLFLTSYYSICFITFTVAQIAFLLLYIFKFFEDPIFLMLPISCLFKFLINSVIVLLVMNESSMKYGLYQLGNSLLTLILTVMFFVQFNKCAEYRILSIILSDCVFVICLFWLDLNKFNYRVSRFFGPEILKFGLPLLISIPGAWLLNESDKVLISIRFNETELGLYTAAVTVTSFVVSINSVLINSKIPELYKKLKSGKNLMEVVLTRTINYAGSYLFFCILFLMTFKLGSEFVVPEKYLFSSQYVYPMVLASLSRSVYAIPGAVFDFYMLSKYKLIYISISGLFASLLMHFGFNYFGLVAGVLGVGAGYFILSLLLITHLFIYNVDFRLHK